MKFEHGNLFSIDPTHVKRIKLAVGLMFLILAGSNFLIPSPTSLSTGRWSWLYLLITETLGPYGYPAIQAAIGCAMIFFAFRSESSKG